MKRFVIILLLMILVLGWGVSDNIYSRTYFNNLNSSVEKLGEDLDREKEDIAVLGDECEKIIESWERHKLYFFMMKNHQQMNNLNSHFIALKGYIDLSLYDMAKIEVLQCESLSGEISKENDICLTNLF